MMKSSIFKTIAGSVAVALTLAAAYLFVPPPRHAYAQFADQGAWAGNATLNTGVTPNVLTITLPNVSQLNDIVGVQIGLNPSANNTAAVNVVITNAMGSTTATALDRPSSIGLTSLSNSELFAGETTSLKYNGSVFVLTSNVDMTPIGATVQSRGTVSRGSLVEDGSCVSQTTYAALFVVISNAYGSCSAGLFKLPDSRGQGFFAYDGQGANGNAGRITTATCATPNNAGGTCGGEKETLTSGNVPSISISVGIAGNNIPITTGTVSNSSTVNTSSSSGNFPQANAGWGNAASLTGTAGNASPSAVATLPPITLGLRAIKY
jgi:hypothetical protein